MTERTFSPKIENLTSEQISPVNLYSRDAVVSDIIDLYHTNELLVDDEKREIRRLVQALHNRKGRFGLFFAICNENSKRKELTQEIIAALSDQYPVQLQLSGNEASLLDTLLAVPDTSEPLIIQGIELLLPSADNKKAEREQTLQELQLRREQFRNLARPLLIWMPEYVYTLIGQQAIDFWSWQNSFFFTNKPFSSDPILEAKNILRRDLQKDWPILKSYIPAPPVNFVGRDQERDQIMAALKNGQNVVISGMEGIGKTSLANFVAESLHSDFPDGQIFISLNNNGDTNAINKELQNTILTLRPDAELSNDFVSLIAIYRGLLKGKRVLIIIDDAPNEKAIYPFLPPDSSVLLVTSRDKINLLNGISLSLDALSPKEGRSLLLNIVPHLELEVVDKLCSLCSYLPLTIKMVGSLLVNRKIDPLFIIDELTDRFGLERGFAQQKYLSLSTILNENYNFLKPETAQVLRQLVIFSSSFDSSAEEVICQDPNNVFLNELVQRNLVVYDEIQNRYSLHDLIQDYINNLINIEERNNAAKRHSIYYASVLRAADQLYQQGGEAIKNGLILFDLEWNNIQAGQKWAATNADKDSVAAEICIAYSDATLLDLRQHPRERIQWLESALIVTRRLNRSQVECAYLGNLGNAYAELGEFDKAIESYEQSLTLCRINNDSANEGRTLNHLGLIYMDLGNYSQGLKFCEQALALAQEKKDVLNEASALCNLARLYTELRIPNLGIEFAEKALAIFRNIGDQRGEATTLGNIGHLYFISNEIKLGIQFIEEELMMLRRINDRRGESKALDSLGQAYLSLKDVSKAIEFFEQSLVIIREIGDKYGEYIELSNLGSAYFESGKIKDSINFFEQSLLITYELKHRYAEGDVLKNLGVVYLASGMVKRALELFERSLIIKREFGDIQGEGSVLFNMSVAVSRLGDYAQGINYAQGAIKIFDQLNSPHAEKAREWLNKLQKAISPK